MAEDRGEQVNKIWQLAEMFDGLGSVAKIFDHEKQLAEIVRRLDMLAAACAQIGASILPIDIAMALCMDRDDVDRWIAGKHRIKDSAGKWIIVSVDDAGLNEEEKEYIARRRSVIKNYLQKGEMVALKASQVQDNRSNGGSLWISQAVFGYGQEKGREQVTFTLEDLITAANNVKARRQSGGT